MTEKERVRFSIDMPADYQAKLAELAKRFKITQGEAVQVMLDQIRLLPEAPFVAKREEKVAARQPRKDLYKKLKSLSPEQLAAIEALADKR